MEDDQGDAAAEAFERLSAEVALLRRAVEGLAAERGRVDVPDYSETLGRMANNITATAQRVDALAKSSAQAMTPVHVASQIVTAASDARRGDQQIIAEARAALDQATRQLGSHMVSARKGDEQNIWLLGIGAGGVVLGMLAWAALAGPIARKVAPESWHWPEKRAARALDLPMWRAGQQLLATADPAAFRAIVAGDRLVTANRDTIERCAKAARKTGESVKCTIRVEVKP